MLKKNASTATSISGFSRRELLSALKQSISSIATDHRVDIGDSVMEYACSIVAELVTSGGPLDIAATILDAYAESKIVNGNKWIVNAIDDVVTDLNVFCSGSQGNRKTDDPIFIVIVRLLCRLTMIVCHAAKTGVMSSARRRHIFLEGVILPSDVRIGEEGMVHLDPFTTIVMNNNTPCYIRSSVVKTLKTLMKTGASEDARALIMLVMSRNGRTVKEYNAMHAMLLRKKCGTDIHKKNEQCSLVEEEVNQDYSSCVSWSPLVFDLFDTDSNNIQLEKTASVTSCRSDDAAWALWRTINEHVSDPKMEDAQEFVTRLASIYSFRWTAARRHIRVNLMLYACTIAMRGHVRCEPPDDDFLELIDVVEARVSNVVNKTMQNEIGSNSECSDEGIVFA